MWYFIASAIALLFGIWIGRRCRPASAFLEKERERQQQAIDQVDIEVRKILTEGKQKVQMIEDQNAKTICALQKSLSDRAEAAHKEAEREFGIFSSALNSRKLELQNELENQKQELKNLTNLLLAKQNEITNYEKAVNQTKIRILQKIKVERELEIKSLEDGYSKRCAEIAEAVSVLENRLLVLSQAERTAYNDHCNKAEIESRNKLGLSVRAIDELRELYDACKKLRLSNPVPLYKAIYELYLRGPVKELGVKLDVVEKCGIYKITNVVSGKVYVGQSVDVAERWKQHIKRGTKCDLGTMAGASLYEAMWEDGVWNFTFQLLEECAKEDLNAREKFWINYFQSNEIGYNRKA